MSRTAIHKHAKAEYRHWADRERALPWWRWRARREARDTARIWAVIAKYSHDEII